MVDYNIWPDNEYDDDDDISIDSFVGELIPRMHEIMKAAARNWHNINLNYKEAWKTRAINLNSRPRNDGKITSLPSSLEDQQLNKTIMDSLTMEWINMAKMLKTAIMSNCIGSSIIATSEKRYKFGREKIELKSQSYRSFFLTKLMQVTIFGSPLFSNLFSHEIVYRTKKEVVVHLLSQRRICDLLCFGGLSGCTIRKWNGTSHAMCARANIRKGGKSAIGYVIDEDDNSMRIKIGGREDLIEIRRPTFDEIPTLDNISSNSYSLFELHPIRIKINIQSGHCSIILSSCTFNDNNELVHAYNINTITNR